MLNSHMHFIDLREIVQFVKASTFSGPRKNVLFLWIEVTRLFIWGNKYKDYVHIFRDQILCLLNEGVPKEDDQLHCLLN